MAVALHICDQKKAVYLEKVHRKEQEKQQQVEVKNTPPAGLTQSQIDFFTVSPDDFAYANEFIAGIPDFLTKYFAYKYKKTFQELGRKSANSWLRGAMGGRGNNVGVLARIEGVMARYKNNYSINTPRANRNVVGLEEFSREEVEDFSKAMADGAYNLLNEFSDKHLNVQMKDDEHIEGTMKALYKRLAYFVQEWGIEAPYYDEYQKGNLTPHKCDIALSKIICESWWFGRLWKLRNQKREHLNIAAGQVHKKASVYCSRECVQMWLEQKRKNTDYIKQMILINDDDPDELIPLEDMFYRTVSNPAVRRCELMVRMRGYEELADKLGYVGEFYTFTAPSCKHANLSKGGFNKKWDFSHPKDTQNYLCKQFSKIRAALSRKGIFPFGFRVVEPHHDGTPHWHLLLFMPKNQVTDCRQIYRRYALEVDGDEAGAKKNRFVAKRIKKSKGSATGYIAKYIAKNIDGYALEGEKCDETGKELKDIAKNVSAWASHWRIHQFQQLGGTPVTVWRELRRLKGKEIADKPELTALIQACDKGEWAKYVELQGGANIKRADLLARTAYEDREPNTYGEISRKVVGVIEQKTIAKEIIITRDKNWTLAKKSTVTQSDHQKQDERSQNNGRSQTISGLCPPWSSVNNCTGSKIEQYLKARDFDVKKLKMALGWRGIPENWINNNHVYILLKGGTVKLDKQHCIKYDGNEILLQ